MSVRLTKKALNGVTKEEFDNFDTEFLILLTAYDETFSQTVHARSSYKSSEVRWGARFSNMYRPPEDGLVSVDLANIHDTEAGPVGTATSAGPSPRRGDAE